MDLFSSSDFSSHVEELIKRHHVPGLAIAVAHNEKVSSAGYGSASLSLEMPCTADTLFDIGSSAKSLTAASVALLVDDDDKYPDVQYDAIMSTLLPDDFVMCDAGYTEGISIDDILGHLTGMPGHDDSYMGSRAAQPDDARSITRNLRNLPVAGPLRSRYRYCNMMYTVASYLVEVKSKQSFSDFLQENLFKPLGMTESCLQPGTAQNRGLGARIATGYFWQKKTSSYREFQSQDCPEGQGAGSIITSANDFIKWVKALMNREGPINEKVYQGLVRMRSFRNPDARKLKPYTSPSFYAAGLEIYYYRGYAVVWHNGNVSGFGSRFFFLPDLKFGAVILGNSAGAASVAAIISQQLIEEVLQVPAAERSHQNFTRKTGNTTKTDVPVHVKTKKQLQAKIKPVSKDNKIQDSGEKTEHKLSSSGKSAERTPRGDFSHLKDKEPQELPLDIYIGKYWHPGYHEMKVEVNNGRLFIDATDRSMGFTLTFTHQSNQTKYMAHLSDLWEDGDDPVPAAFVFNNEKVARMGLKLENGIKEKIWFSRIE